LTEEKFSEDFLIDNTPPQIKDDIFQNNRLSFTAFDEESFIDKVEFSINGGEFKDVFPVDQIFDNREENFSIDIPFNGKVPLSILVKVYDKFGNVTFLKKFVKMKKVFFANSLKGTLSNREIIFNIQKKFFLQKMI